MLNAPAAVRRAFERVVHGQLPALDRDHHRGPAPASQASRSPAAHGRRSAARHDPPFVVLAAAAVIVLRRNLARLVAGRRPVPLAALAILAVCALLPQTSGIVVGSSGATGGTNGAGSAVNARIMQINVDGPDTGQVDPTLVDGLTLLPGSTPPPDGGSLAASSYTMVDGSLIKPITAEASAAADISGQVRTYVVRSGDTLSGIANRFGLSMMTIWWANKLTSKDSLQVGQKLHVPPVDGVLYTVQAGDTVTSIARRYHASAADVRTFNDLTGDTVVIGQEVMVPDGRGAAIPTPAPAPVQPQTGSGGGESGSSGTPADGPVGGGCSSCAFAGTMGWPVPGGYISQYYWWGHPALDIAAPYGTPVLAAASGVVIYAGWRNNGGGYQVWISHGNDVYTTYNHMSAVTVGVGQSVARGQEVGRVGATGVATGPHCHFEVWIGPIWAGGSRVNPLNYVSH